MKVQIFFFKTYFLTFLFFLSQIKQKYIIIEIGLPKLSSLIRYWHYFLCKQIRFIPLLKFFYRTYTFFWTIIARSDLCVGGERTLVPLLLDRNTGWHTALRACNIDWVHSTLLNELEDCSPRCNALSQHLGKPQMKKVVNDISLTYVR